MICQHEEVVAASGVRITWMQIPARVWAGIEAILGGGAAAAARRLRRAGHSSTTIRKQF